MHAFDAPPAAHGPAALGYRPMDLIHEEFETLVAQALHCDDDRIPVAIAALCGHLQSHFAEEDRWMEETGFPARDCHMAEHAAVLASASEVFARVQAGRHALGRSFAQALADWFPPHADYLDSALAHWMCKRATGGKPVVFHPRSRPARSDADALTT